MNGAFVVDVGAEKLDGARAALARAIASGALGPGRTVRRDGDGCTFDDGRIDVGSDGRVTFSLSLRRLERLRVAEAVLLAATVSVAATLGWSLIVYAALATGALVGAGWAVARIAGDRATARRRVAALVASLPVLVDARRQ
ncbi:MAG TPA: hypothetical protein VF997_25080 [Polyangia bacterium]